VRPIAGVETETVNHLEVLQRVCARKGWKVLLRSSGLKVHLRPSHDSELTFLDVADRDGDVLDRCPLANEVTVAEAATVLLRRLQRTGQLP
jgi:hypothetical protein